MTTIDSLLTTIINHNISDAELYIPARDIKVLKNLARLINEPNYITANQAALLVKILKTHQERFSNSAVNIQAVIENPVWERSFRVINVVRKIYINNNQGISQIIIEFTFSAEIQRVIANLSKTVEGLYVISNGKIYGAALTEKNIVEILDKFKDLKFTVSEELQEYYKTIKSWSKTDILDQYRITTITYPNFEKQIISDLGIETEIDQNIINDRSIRYQYFAENPEKNSKNLSEILANRESTKVWVDNTLFSLTNLINAFINLRRLPILVVLDTRDEKTCLENLKNLSQSLEELGIIDGVGVYFRLDNDAVGKEFNQLIAAKKYNCHLDTSSKVVVVQSGKIPKFLLKSDWKPMSVVSLDHILRHSKTAVYANCCDLIITYTSSQPIIESRSPWE